MDVKEYILLSRDGEEMLMAVETDADSFLDLLLDFKETGFAYQFLTKKEYHHYKDNLHMEGYSVKK